MLPPCSTEKAYHHWQIPPPQYAWKIEQEIFLNAHIFVMRGGANTNMFITYLLEHEVVLPFISLGARQRRLTSAERCVESQRLAGRQSVSAPAVRIWGDRYINMGPIKYGECNLWKWQIILSVLSGNCQRCITENVSERNTGSASTRMGSTKGDVRAQLSDCAFSVHTPLCRDGMKLLLSFYGALHLLGPREQKLLT